MKNAVFWDVTPCDFYKNRRFGGTFIRSVFQLLVTVNVVSSSLNLFSDDGGDSFSETSFLTRTTRRHVLEHCILL
jgi:hypothetical protein